jgi:hypothetical protein
MLSARYLFVVCVYVLSVRNLSLVSVVCCQLEVCLL